jgi:hypothetical protein
MRKRLNGWSNIWLGLAEENSRYCTAWNSGGALFHKTDTAIVACSGSSIHKHVRGISLSLPRPPRAHIPRPPEIHPDGDFAFFLITALDQGVAHPAVIVLCGCLISLISFGPRSSLGFFLTPQSQANGWGRDVFGLALAVQNILWGLAQPLAGMLADAVLSILFGLLSAVINLPIVEKPLPRLAAAAA